MGGGNPLLAASSNADLGLRFKGLCLTPPSIREGISTEKKKPYCISSQKLLAGEQTYTFLVIRKTRDELEAPLPVGETVYINVESADKRNRDSDIEIIGTLIS